MTTIFALKHDNKVYMGGDSGVNNGYMQRTLLTQEPDFRKVWRWKGWLIGASGSYRTNQVVQAFLGEYAVEHEAGSFVGALVVAEGIRHAAEAFGCIEQDDDGQQRTGSTFLLAAKDKLYLIGARFEVLAFNEEAVAFGSGQDYATGAWYIIRNDPAYQGLTPDDIVSRCLMAAAVYDPYTSFPFYWYCTEAVTPHEK